jgi:hypothetical protein
VLGNPYAGAVLGSVLAVAFLRASRSSVAVMKPGAEAAGLVLFALSLFGRLALATLLLWAYRHFAPTGFKPFALVFAVGFIVLYTLELVRFAGLSKLRRPMGARQ